MASFLDQWLPHSLIVIRHHNLCNHIQLGNCLCDSEVALDIRSIFSLYASLPSSPIVGNVEFSDAQDYGLL